MNASKENARKVGEFLRGFLQVEITFMQDFLKAAERKLPSEAAYRRAKSKRFPRGRKVTVQEVASRRRKVVPTLVGLEDEQ